MSPFQVEDFKLDLLTQIPNRESRELYIFVLNNYGWLELFQPFSEGNTRCQSSYSSCFGRGCRKQAMSII